MSKIHSLISDLDLDLDLLKNIKDRKVDQKHFYTSDEASDIFLKTTENPNPRIQEQRDSRNFFKFYEDNIGNKSRETALISLGCGDASLDKKILTELSENKYNFVYIGVDSSRSMLEKARENLSKCKFEQVYICSDIGAHNFKSELSAFLGIYSCRVFAFLGGTIGNIMPTNIVDTLINMISKDDYLWVDVVSRDGTDEASDFKLFKVATEYLSDPNEIAFWFNPLKRLGVPFKNGELTVEMLKENSFGALRFKFGFKFYKKTPIEFRGEKITILPEEDIELFNIRVYDSEKFIAFFLEHNFTLMAKLEGESYGQFLFQKKK